MGFVPPRLIRPRATPDLSLLEGVKAYAPVETLSRGRSNRATLALMKMIEREIEGQDEMRSPQYEDAIVGYENC